MDLAEALNTVVRIDLTPAELDVDRIAAPRWWEVQDSYSKQDVIAFGQAVVISSSRDDRLGLPVSDDQEYLISAVTAADSLNRAPGA